MPTLGLTVVIKEYGLEDQTMTETDLKIVYIFSIFPRHSIITADKGFLNTGDGSMGGSHWTCFYMKDNKSFHFDSFGGQANKSLLQQLPKPITSHEFKFQDTNSK